MTASSGRGRTNYSWSLEEDEKRQQLLAITINCHRSQWVWSHESMSVLLTEWSVVVCHNNCINWRCHPGLHSASWSTLCQFVTLLCWAVWRRENSQFLLL